MWCSGEEMIPSEELVPGDLLVISPTRSLMTSDALLVTGTSILNESVLTGNQSNTNDPLGHNTL